MAETLDCARCGAQFPAEPSIEGLCPRCLLLLGLGADLHERKRIGQYEIISELGRGGMGVVYKAYEGSLNRIVALKVLSQHLSQDATFVKRFEREARLAAQLSHPNIVHIYAVGDDDGVHYIAMEYVKGPSLRGYIQQEGQLGVDEALKIIRRVASALADAHKRGIIHRDIKPQNIMLDQAGRVKVTDFGLAKVQQARTHLTAEGAQLGTPMYMAPEQVRGLQTDARTDIYALGATLYEMLAGRGPFTGDTPLAIMHQITQEPFPSITEQNSDVPRVVVEMLTKMTAKNPDDRYQSCEALCRDLDKIIGRRPSVLAEVRPKSAPAPVLQEVSEVPPSPEPTRAAGKLVKTAFAILAAVGAAVVLVIGGYLAVGMWRPGQEVVAPQLPQAGKITDPEGNLRGDTSRRFMDIVESTLELRGSEYVLTVSTAAPFPSTEEMSGGKRFDFIWFVDIDSDTRTGQSHLGNDYNIHLWLDEKGWWPAWYKVSHVSMNDGVRVLDGDFRITHEGNVASLAFPKHYLPAESFVWWVTAMTGNAPQWSPYTENPHTKSTTFASDASDSVPSASQTSPSSVGGESIPKPGSDAASLSLFDPFVDGLDVSVNGAVRHAVKPLRWDWGDGSQSTSWFPASHVYPAAGRYKIGVGAEVRDNAGPRTLTREVYVEVGEKAHEHEDPENIHRLSIFLAKTEGRTVIINGVVVAPVKQIQWNWGDGTVIDHHFFPATHTYANDGEYLVQVSTRDDKGRVSVKTLVVRAG